MGNMRKAHKRHYGAEESRVFLKSKLEVHPAPDLSPYDIAIDVLKAREKTLIKRVEQIGKDMPLSDMAGGESILMLQSSLGLHHPAIKGLGSRLWWGIVVTANDPAAPEPGVERGAGHLQAQFLQHAFPGGLGAPLLLPPAGGG